MESYGLARDVDDEVELHRVQHLLISWTDSFSCFLEVFLREQGFYGRMLLEVKVVLSKATYAGNHLNVSLSDCFRSTSHDEVKPCVYSAR